MMNKRLMSPGRLGTILLVAAVGGIVGCDRVSGTTGVPADAQTNVHDFLVEFAHEALAAFLF